MINEQGSGRTWRLVNDSRDGDFFVVVHYYGRDEVRRILERQGRHHDSLRLVCLADDRAANRLRGQPPGTRVYVDHTAASIAALDAQARRTLAEVEEVATARYGGLHFYPVAEPCDTGAPGIPPAHEARV